MAVVPSTFLAIAAILLIFLKGPHRGVWLFMLLTPFGAAAAFNLPALGGASIGMMDLAAVVLFMMVAIVMSAIWLLRREKKSLDAMYETKPQEG